MTQSEFNALPPSLAPGTVKKIFDGLSDEGLKTLRESYPQIVALQMGNKHLYCKKEIAKLAKLDYQ